MTPARRVRGIAAVLATIVAATLATTAQGDAHAASGMAGSGGGGPRHTTLRLHITGCDHCTVQLQHAVSGARTVWTSQATRIGSDHVATFDVRTSRTHGMSFVLRAPWQGDTGAVSNIVTRYAGHRVDSFVSRTTARHAGKAEGCWAGTSGNDLRLSFRVSRVPATTLDGQPTHIPLAYAPHSMSSWKPAVKTFKGTIGNQDAFYCTRPPTTKVTFAASGCSGCEMQVMNGAVRLENLWSADPKTFAHGQVIFRIPRNETKGITATLVAPWEGATGYTTLLAFRYGHHAAGDPVSFKDARSRRHASPCWGGTTAKSLTLPLTIRKVTVPGTTGPAAGTIAFADVTQSWLAPMLPAGKGVIGSQEVVTCQK